MLPIFIDREDERNERKLKFFKKSEKFSQGTICERKSEISIKIFLESWKQVGSSKIPEVEVENQISVK